MHVLGRVVAVAAQDGVRERLGERDRNVEHELALAVRELETLAAHQLDDVLDVADIVGNIDFDHPGRIPGVVATPAVGLGRSARVRQKLFSARSRVSAIWNSVSSFVSSKSVFRSSLRFARRSSPPCSRIFLESETRTPRPELSM